MKHLLLLIGLITSVSLGQVPLNLHSTDGVCVSDEGDVWFQDLGTWVPFGNAYTINRQMLTITNVAAMIQIPARTNASAKIVQTMGYYTPGDGGGGMYQLVTKTTTNMGRFASTNSAFMWQLMPDQGGTKLKQYGAKGDGTTDDTLAVKDWLKDINQKIGVVNVGTYIIQPIFTEPNAVLTIQGANRFGMTSPNINTFLFDGNSARFKRIANSGSTNALINVVSNAVCNMYSIALDGNKAGDPSQTNSYLYLNNGGLSSEIESCYFGGSAGHGICIVGPSGNWSVIRNCRIYDVNRGIRLNQTSGITINNVHIQFCRDNGLSLVSFANMTRCNQLYIGECAMNGIFLEGATHNRFIDCEIQRTFMASVMMSMTNNNNIADNAFFQCTFISANTATTTQLGASPYAAGLWSPVTVVSDTTTTYAWRNRFDGCVFGDITGNAQNRSKYALEWQPATTGGLHTPWEMWMFANNQYVWCPQWISDYGPLLSSAHNVAEINCIHANNSMQSQFGLAGAINGAGLRIDVVSAGVAGGTNAVTYLSSGSHALTRDTAGYGTVVPPSTREPDDDHVHEPPPPPLPVPVPNP